MPITTNTAPTTRSDTALIREARRGDGNEIREIMMSALLDERPCGHLDRSRDHHNPFVAILQGPDGPGVASFVPPRGTDGPVD
jgi:hypothetical protein